MSERPEHPLDLILAYEELVGDERASADRHLAECAYCRALLEESRGIEAMARRQARGLTDIGDRPADPLAGRSEEEFEDARASREALLQRLVVVTPPVAWWKRGRIVARGLAVAAVLVVAVVFAPRMSRNQTPFSDAGLAPLVVARDTVRPLAAGDPLTLRFTPLRDGWPVVLKVDEHGALLLCPTLEVPGARLMAGMRTVLPAATGDGVVGWVYGGDDAAERWLLAIAGEELTDPQALVREMAALDLEEDENLDVSTARVLRWLRWRFDGAGEISTP